MSLEALLGKIRNAPVPPNEEAAKCHVIAPILGCLGWDQTDGSEFLLEHCVGGKKGGRVDIALRDTSRRNRRVVALIEAKAPGSNLEQHVGQVLSYAFHDGVDICVLTTGIEWWLFLPRETGDPLQRRFAALHLQKDSTGSVAGTLLDFLNKEALTSGSAQTAAKKALQATLDAARLKTEIPGVWIRMRTRPDSDLVSLVAAKVRDELGLDASAEQVVAVLNGDPVPDVGHTAPAPATSGTPLNAPDQSAGLRQAKRRSVKPVAVTLWGFRHTVSSHKDVLARVVDGLHDRHPDTFGKALELRGRANPYMSRNATELKAPRRVASSSYYVDTHLSAAAIVQRAELFLDCFGYPKTDLVVELEQPADPRLSSNAPADQFQRPV